ncbi:MAG: peptidylprolyl isomerase [Acholeplasmatales bacterium]|jgi:peptidyl-prolyl cis-trans isomerase B (cyclophilin B)|nr:peptidylprolyl isomerase [Acholeplasmatales bacterium]
MKLGLLNFVLKVENLSLFCLTKEFLKKLERRIDMNYKEFLNENNPKVSITIKKLGTILLELFPEVAPKTVKNFINLVQEGFYNGLTFHRIIEGFMIQGGDPLGTGVGGSKEKIEGEFSANGFSNPLEHTRGVISMARSMMPNSASSQFFIMHKDAPHLDGAYAAFGACIEGIEIVDAIASVAVDFQDKPLSAVIIEKMELI